jgi:mono/diheme cytochrome c family protein
MRRSVNLSGGPWVLVTLAAVGLSLTAAVGAQVKPGAGAKPGGGSAVARGKYLVTAVADCGGCHTPAKIGPNGPEPDESRMLSGVPASGKAPAPTQQGPWLGFFTLEGAFGGPWGLSYPANLTPDKETGLGSWTEQQFIDTLRTGRHQGRGREILPPMPWRAFRNMTDADLKAIFAYLRTIPAVTNKVPDPVIAPPPKGK